MNVINPVNLINLPYPETSECVHSGWMAAWWLDGYLTGISLQIKMAVVKLCLGG